MTDLTQLLQDAEAAIQQLAEQKERESLFQTKSQQLFDANLLAFEQYYPNIAASIRDYKPDEDFKVLVTPSGLGNYRPKNSPVPLYGDDPMETVRTQVQKNVEQGYYSFTNYGFGGHQQDERIHIQYMNKIDDLLVRFNKENSIPISALTEHFPSAMIFGVGLGYHISMLLEKHSFNYMFICEPDFELFYTSLYCTDWAEIFSKIDNVGHSLFIQVGVSYKDFFSFLNTIASSVGVFSFVRCFCYQHYPSMELNELIKTFFSRYAEFQMGFGFYNDAITGLSHAITHIKNNRPFYVMDVDARKKYKNIPVYVVGNGPSLDDAEELLKRNRDSVIIIAAGTALGSLLKMGITPDFHVVVERVKSTYDVMVDMLPRESYQKLNLLSVDVMYPDVLELYNWSGIGLKGPEAASTFIQLQCFLQNNFVMATLPYCGPMVSNLALAYAVEFGFQDIYLIGVNNGKVSDVTHSKHSIYNDEKNKFATALTSSANRKVEGNLDMDVMTSELLYVSKKQIENLVSVYKDRYFYNVGHGAKIEGAYSLREDMVLDSKPLKDKTVIVEGIKSDFFRSSIISFDEPMLQLAIFEDMCQHMIDISSEPFQSRIEASNLLKRQASYLYSHDNTLHIHLFHMLKGSLLYYHCPMITLLYRYVDDELTLRYFRECMTLWIEYLEAMKTDFRNSWQKKCEAGLVAGSKLTSTAVV